MTNPEGIRQDSHIGSLIVCFSAMVPASEVVTGATIDAIAPDYLPVFYPPDHAAIGPPSASRVDGMMPLGHEPSRLIDRTCNQSQHHWFYRRSLDWQDDF
jgi:hypothetical protein